MQYLQHEKRKITLMIQINNNYKHMMSMQRFFAG